MKLTKLHAAALVPVAIAGVAFSTWAAVDASASHPARQVHASQVLPAQRLNGGIAAHRSTPKPASPQRPAAQPRAGHATAAKADHRASPAAKHVAQAKHLTHAKHVTRAKPAAATTPQPVAETPSLQSGMSAFEQCVAWRESGDNPTASSSGLFGILPATWASLGYPGTAGGSSVALQKAAFDRLYAADGTQPWAPYDGC
jgi:hypothetical protein